MQHSRSLLLLQYFAFKAQTAELSTWESFRLRFTVEAISVTSMQQQRRIFTEWGTNFALLHVRPCAQWKALVGDKNSSHRQLAAQSKMFIYTWRQRAPSQFPRRHSKGIGKLLWQLQCPTANTQLSDGLRRQPSYPEISRTQLMKFASDSSRHKIMAD